VASTQKRTWKRWFVLAAITLAVAASETSASALDSPRVFSLLELPGAERSLGFEFDQPPRGGDQFGFVDPLYRWAGTERGARVGRVEVMATFQTGFGADFSQHAAVLIIAQAYIPGGTVLVQGYGRINPDGPSKFTLPVIGGTGIYENARGYVKVRDLGNGNSGKSNVQFHLLP
jgi:hypothetical protein